jgi:hypothetical protein
MRSLMLRAAELGMLIGCLLLVLGVQHVQARGGDPFVAGVLIGITIPIAAWAVYSLVSDVIGRKQTA